MPVVVQVVTLVPVIRPGTEPSAQLYTVAIVMAILFAIMVMVALWIIPPLPKAVLTLTSWFATKKFAVSTMTPRATDVPPPPVNVNERMG